MNNPFSSKNFTTEAVARQQSEAIKEQVRRHLAAIDQAKCLEDHISRAKVREMIVRACFEVHNRWRDWEHKSMTDPDAEAIADRLLADDAQQEKELEK